MFNVLHKLACMQSSSTVSRTNTMDYRPSTAAWH